jgi:hypothetical protein
MIALRLVHFLKFISTANLNRYSHKRARYTATLKERHTAILLFPRNNTGGREIFDVIEINF